MSNFMRFMKKNKIQKENTTFPATKSLTDENGAPLLWEIKPLTTAENEAIRDECMIEIPIKGKPNAFRSRVNTSKYMAKLASAAVVMPDLWDKELQDSYGVMTPEDLIKAMIDDPNEYQEFVNFVMTYSGFSSAEDEVETAKN